MKKAILFSLSVCLIAALLIFSGSTDRGSEATNIKTAVAASPSASAAPAENVIRVGVPATMTGLGTSDDARVLLGLQYAHSVSPSVEIGSTTYKIELVKQDDGGTAAGAQSAAQALKKAGVSAVIGSFRTKSAADALPLYDKAGIPALALCCADPDAGKDAASFFRLGAGTPLYGGAAASLAQSLDKHSAAVLVEKTDTASQALGKAFETAFTALGGSCKEYAYTAGRKNDSSLAQAIQQSGADVVFMASGAEDGEAFLRLARREGVLCPVIGPSSWDAGLLLSDADYYSESVYAIADYDGCGTDEVSSGFASRFSAWAGDAKNAKLQNGGSTYASSYSALGYDAYMLLLSAIKTAGSTDPQAITDALRKTQYSGVTGTVSFGKDGSAVRTLACVKELDRKAARFDLLKTVQVGA